MEKRVVRGHGGLFLFHGVISDTKKNELLRQLEGGERTLEARFPGSHRVDFPSRVAAAIRRWLLGFLEETECKGCVPTGGQVKIFANEHGERSRKHAKADAAIKSHRDGAEDEWLMTVVASTSECPSSIRVATAKNFALDHDAKNIARFTESVVVPDGMVHVFPGSHVTHGVPQSRGWRKAIVGFFPVKQAWRRRVLEVLHQKTRICMACNVGFRSDKGLKLHKCKG